MARLSRPGIRRWTLDVEYAWTDARFDSAIDGSREIPGALEHVLSGGINLQLNDRFNAYLRLRHFEDYPVDSGKRADASTILNMRMTWDINEQLNLSLDLLNLLDSNDRDISYFYESQLAGENAPVGDEHYHVFEPRSLRAYVTWRFCPEVEGRNWWGHSGEADTQCAGFPGHRRHSRRSVPFSSSLSMASVRRRNSS